MLFSTASALYPATTALASTHLPKPLRRKPTMRLVPKLSSKPLKTATRVTRRLKAWHIVPPSSPSAQTGGIVVPAASNTKSRRRRSHAVVEKRIFGNACDYADVDDDDEEDEEDVFVEEAWGEDAYVLLRNKGNCGGCREVHRAGGCAGDRRAGTAGWEYESRRMMF